MRVNCEKYYSNNYEQISAEVVLSILKDSHQQQCQYDPEADSEIILSFNSTINEWRYACDLVKWKPLGRSLNSWFGITYTDEQWHKVLEPADKRTLFDVCTLISSTATRLSVTPLNIFGHNCLEAGAYVTLRTALADAGVPVSSIKPSTKLDPWLTKYWGEFSDVMGKLAPEALPPVEFEISFFQKTSYWILLSGIILGLSNLLIDHIYVSTAAISLTILGFFLILVASKLRLKRVSFGDLETFGDVCHLISQSVKDGNKAKIN